MTTTTTTMTLLKYMEHNASVVYIEDVVKRLPLTSGYFISTVLLLYLIGVVLLGRFSLKRNTPLDSIRPLIILYNWCQIVLNVALVLIVIQDRHMVGYAWNNVCNLHFVVDSLDRAKLIVLGWLWMILKCFDLLDTLFFVLLCKFKHVSFLHVFHHTSTVLITWYALHYLPANQNLFMATINSVIHSILYYYYFLTSLGYQVSWKKALTLVQVIQFVIMIVFMSALMTCQTHPALTAYTTCQLLQITIFLMLFLNFFIKTYKSTTTSSLRRDNKRNAVFDLHTE